MTLHQLDTACVVACILVDVYGVGHEMLAEDDVVAHAAGHCCRSYVCH